MTVITIWPFPHLQLVVFHCLSSNGNAVTHLTWLQRRRTISDRFLCSVDVKNGKNCWRMTVQYVDNCMAQKQIYEWVKRLIEGPNNLVEDVRSGRPSTVTRSINVSGTTKEWELTKLFLKWASVMAWCRCVSRPNRRHFVLMETGNLWTAGQNALKSRAMMWVYCCLFSDVGLLLPVFSEVIIIFSLICCSLL
jgi:hypothetical protein